jgi:hypothetical protein
MNNTLFLSPVLILIILLGSSFILLGCSSQTSQTTTLTQTVSDVSYEELADESVSGWMDENQDVLIGELI